MKTHTRTLEAAALTLVLAALVACSGGYDSPTDPGGGTPPPQPNAVLLKDVVIERLPSPFYHFTYDASGRVSDVSYASGMDDFGVTYAGAKIKELTNTGGIGNRDRIVYAYDDAGRVGGV